MSGVLLSTGAGLVDRAGYEGSVEDSAIWFGSTADTEKVTSYTPGLTIVIAAPAVWVTPEVMAPSGLKVTSVSGVAVSAPVL